MRTFLIAAILSAAVGIGVLVQGPRANAQFPPPPNPSPTNRVPLATPQRGDVVYAFSEEQPWNDPRVGLALAVMIDQQLSASVRAHILPANELLRVASAVDQVPLLLAAAGYPGRSPFMEVAQCKLWAAPPPVDVQVAVPYGQAAKEFEAAFLAAMGQLGVDIQPCAIVATPNQAHILLWYQGGPAPTIPKRSTATFLTGNVLAPPPGGLAPTPPRGGNTAVTARDGGMPARSRVLLAVLGVLLISGWVVGARSCRRSSAEPGSR